LCSRGMHDKEEVKDSSGLGVWVIRNGSLAHPGAAVKLGIRRGLRDLRAVIHSREH
jgi:hypothetical protein